MSNGTIETVDDQQCPTFRAKETSDDQNDRLERQNSQPEIGNDLQFLTKQESLEAGEATMKETADFKQFRIQS